MARKKKEETDEVEVTNDKVVETVKEEIVTEKREKKKKIEEGKAEKKERKKKAKKAGEEKIDELVRKKKELEERAKKLGEGLKEETTEELKEKVEAARKKGTLVPIDDYVKAGVYIGAKVITPHMRKYVYRKRADGVSILNTTTIDKKIKEAAEFLSKYAPEDFIIVCKREAGWRAVKKFSELTGVRVFTKKYPAGILTNLSLPNFFETKLVVVCDPWLDKNALRDANKINRTVLGVCDTNNYTFGIDFILPCNNKGNKSLGLLFYILAREYLKAKGIKKEMPELIEFTGEEL